MTNEPDELSWVEKSHARFLLRQKVDDYLRGSGLQAREMVNDLAISNPHDPDKGRIYVKYANGDVSRKRVIWEHLGRLQGYDGDDPNREPGVDAATIIATLTDPKPPEETP